MIMMRVPVRLQNVILSVAAPWLGQFVKIGMLMSPWRMFI